MKGWHWLCDRFLSLTPVTPVQLSSRLIPLYLSPSDLPSHYFVVLAFILSLSSPVFHPSLFPALSLFAFPRIAHISAHLCYWIWLSAHHISASEISTCGCFYLWTTFFLSLLFDMLSACSLIEMCTLLCSGQLTVTTQFLVLHLSIMYP